MLALSGPSTPVSPGSGSLKLHWTFVGKPPSSYSIKVDGKPVANGITGSAYDLDIAGLHAGAHRVQLRAAGVQTRFSLDPAKAAIRSPKPLPVWSEWSFDLTSPAQSRGTK